MDLLKRYVLFMVLLPHLIYAIMTNCPISSLKLGLALLFFLPLSLYFLPPAFLAGNNGFICQIGCGPISPLGYTISLVVWTLLSVALATLHIRLRSLLSIQLPKKNC